MYGSQYHAHHALTQVRPSTQELATRTSYKLEKKINRKISLSIFIFIFIALSISSLSYAGPSQPRLKGGNGNTNGR
ncbi:MAG: hypothetical protein H7281_00760 [Bacteriovorax sp.]|nr:hypothetical protein [Bacteriovorax sp.]